MHLILEIHNDRYIAQYMHLSSFHSWLNLYYVWSCIINDNKDVHDDGILSFAVYFNISAGNASVLRLRYNRTWKRALRCMNVTKASATWTIALPTNRHGLLYRRALAHVKRVQNKHLKSDGELIVSWISVTLKREKKKKQGRIKCKQSKTRPD